MSTDAVELKKLVKQFQDTTNEQDILSLLGRLKSEFKVNEALLRESKAGLAVGKLQSHSNKAIAELAKELVKKWKTEVEKAKASRKSVSVAPPTPTTASAPTPPAAVAATKAKVTSPAVRTAKSDGVKPNTIGNDTRDKCMLLVYDALASDSGAPTDQILRVATSIEDTVYGDNNGAGQEYKSKIRSLFVNLKDKGNPGLRENVVDGSIDAKKFARMTSQEMASDARKAQNAKIEEQNLHDSLGAEEQQAETEAFQCGRCKQRKCRYRQAQTRSADEPMTTFVTCVNCNNRWKFS